MHTCPIEKKTNSNEHSSHKMKLYEMNVVNPSQKRVLTKPDMNRNTNKYHVLGQNRIWAVLHFSYFFAHVMQGNLSKFKFLKIIFFKLYYRIDCVQESASSKKRKIGGKPTYHDLSQTLQNVRALCIGYNFFLYCRFDYERTSSKIKTSKLLLLFQPW